MAPFDMIEIQVKTYRLIQHRKQLFYNRCFALALLVYLYGPYIIYI